VGEPFGEVVRFNVTNACFKLEDILDEMHDLDETPLEGSRDVFMHEESPSLGFNDSVISNPLDHSHVSLCVPNLRLPLSILSTYP